MLSALLFGWALYLAGPGAAYTLAGVLAAGGVLYVLARARVFRQRNGVFLAGAIVCFLGVFLVLVQQAWLAATHPAKAAARAETAAAPAQASAPAGTPPPLPALVEAFKPSPAELESGSVAKVLRTLNVEVEGKLYRLRTGDVLPVAGMSANEVRLAAGTQEVGVPPAAVEVSEPRGFTPPRREPDPAARSTDTGGKDAEKATLRSHQEAMKKYPALAQKGSPENQSFVEAYRELKYAGGASFFEDPEWPMRLADQLAAREGWGQPKSAEMPEKTAPARMTNDLPADPAPPARELQSQ